MAKRKPDPSPTPGQPTLPGIPARRPPRPPEPPEDPVALAILASPEPLTAIAARFAVTKARVRHVYGKLVRAGHAVPERRTGRPSTVIDVGQMGGPGHAGTSGQPATIGERIAARRMSLGLSQRDVAARMIPPSHQPTVGNCERAGDKVDHDLIVRIAGALSCDPCDLDPKLAPAGAVSLVRVSDDIPGVVNPRWEGLRAADREWMAREWVGYGPPNDDLGTLVGRAVEDGVAVVIRGDLPVRADGAGDQQGEGGR